jgi:hypothetical protein
MERKIERCSPWRHLLVLSLQHHPRHLNSSSRLHPQATAAEGPLQPATSIPICRAPKTHIGTAHHPDLLGSLPRSHEPIFSPDLVDAALASLPFSLRAHARASRPASTPHRHSSRPAARRAAAEGAGRGPPAPPLRTHLATHSARGRRRRRGSSDELHEAEARGPEQERGGASGTTMEPPWRLGRERGGASARGETSGGGGCGDWG